MTMMTRRYFILSLVFVLIGCGLYSAEAKTPVLTITPTDLTAAAVSPTQINLSWAAPTQNYGKTISGYKIEQELHNGIYDILVETTGNTITTYSITGLETGITYTYRVSAVYSDYSTTDPSNSASATPTLTSTPPPTPPLSSPITNVKLDFVPSDGTTLSSVVLTQNDYVALEYKKDPRSLLINPVPTSESINNNLAGVITYQNNHLAQDSVPGPLISKVVAFNQIALSWLPPLETYGQHIVGYKIDWKRAPGDYVVIDDNSGNDTTRYYVKDLVPGATYTYRVSAVYSTHTVSNPSNEASVILVLPTPPTPKPLPNPDSSHNNTGTTQTPPPQITNVKLDFTTPDGSALTGVIITQSDYQQFVVIKDPRSILSHVGQTSDTINNDLAGLLRYQNLHTPQESVNPPIPQPPNSTSPTETTPSASNNQLFQGVITSVVATGVVGIITWFVRTKIARKIAKEFHFTLEKFTDNGVSYVRIRNSGETIENCVILCDKDACVWTDTHTDRPRHVYEGSISNVKISEVYENENPLIIVKSGNKIIKKIRFNDMAHG